MEVDGKTINIANIDSMDFITFERHSLFANFKDWFYGLIGIFIVACIWSSLNFLLILYLLSAILLFWYNFKEAEKQFYGLKILTNHNVLIIKSEDNDFIHDVHKAIVKAMNSRKVNFVVNMDNRVVNNGIISNGGSNINVINNYSDLNYDEILKELEILESYVKESLEEIKQATLEKNPSKICRALKYISKESIEGIRHLGLTTLDILLEKILNGFL